MGFFPPRNFDLFIDILFPRLILDAGFLLWILQATGSTHRKHTPTTSLSGRARSSSALAMPCARSSRTASRPALRLTALLVTPTLNLDGPLPLAASRCSCRA